MTSPDEDFDVRLGRIRDQRAGRVQSFVGQVLAAAERSGGVRQARARRASTFGRGRAASLRANHGRPRGARGAMIKARVVRHTPGRGPLSVHIDYLRRDGVTQEGARGVLFDAEREDADGAAFVRRGEDDRHHFRFIVSPDDAEQLVDLKAFTRQLMAQAEQDLGTRLDWVAVDHWNTGHPHIHVLVRGRTDDGQDLVISRDYIAEGLRARAGQLVTRELGLRSEQEIRRGLEAEVGAERWTRLDRALARQAGEQGVIDLRPSAGSRADPLRSTKIARLQKLERLGLARAVGPARWHLSAQAEPTLRTLSRRNDIIARLHDAFAHEPDGRDPSRFSVQSESDARPIVGRLAARGLDDELSGSAFVVIDGLDGRVHHVALPSLDAATDAKVGAVVEARPLRNGALVLRVRSDLELGRQVTAEGATFLDRQLVSREPEALADDGFGREVKRALADRVNHLVSKGLARREGGQVVFARGLVETLQQRELASAAARLSSETGLAHQPAAEGETVGGIYRRRVDLASGRFAMLDGGLGFQLVPWRPELERHLGQRVAGVALAGGGVDWSFGRPRGPAR